MSDTPTCDFRWHGDKEVPGIITIHGTPEGGMVKMYGCKTCADQLSELLTMMGVHHMYERKGLEKGQIYLY